MYAQLAKNSTLPVGVPPAPATVAVYVTDCPPKAGFREEETVVVVGVPDPNVTVCVRGADVLPSCC